MEDETNAWEVSGNSPPTAALNTERTERKCWDKKCNNLALPDKEHCGSARCKSNFTQMMSRRRKGILSKAEIIMALPPRICKLDSCGIEFQPTSHTQEYCMPEHRKEAKHNAFDLREACLKMLDFAIVKGIKGIDWEAIRWVPKKEYFKTDRRHTSTLELVAEAKRYRDAEGEMTLRFLFYHLVSIQMIRNTPEEYSGMISKMTDARERGDIAPDAFSDNGRESITYYFDSNLVEFKETVSAMYSMDLWKNQARLVEIWTEKDSIVSVIESTVKKYKVPLRVLRGQGSTPYLFGITKELKDVTKPISIFFL